MESKIYEAARKVAYIINSCTTDEQFESADRCVDLFRDQARFRVGLLYDKVKYRPWKIMERRDFNRINEMASELYQNLTEALFAKHTELNPPSEVHHAPTPRRIKGFVG